MKLKDTIFKKKKGEESELIEEIRETQRQLENVEKCFSHVSDDNLIDACIFEREALCARHRYLISKARINKTVNQPFTKEF